MSLEDEMQAELRKLEHEISILDDELEKLHSKILQLLLIRKKKDHDLRILKSNLYGNEDEKEFQTTLAKMLEKEGIKHIVR